MTKQENATRPYSILAFCFADRSKAGEVMKELKAAKTLEEHHVVAEAVVEVDEHGKAHVINVAAVVWAWPRHHGRRSAGTPRRAGRLAGDGRSRWRDRRRGRSLCGSRFSKEELAKLKEQMPPNSSAILTMAKESETEKIAAAMQHYQAAVVTLVLGDEATGALDQAVADSAEKDAGESSPRDRTANRARP